MMEKKASNAVKPAWQAKTKGYSKTISSAESRTNNSWAIMSSNNSAYMPNNSGLDGNGNVDRDFNNSAYMPNNSGFDGNGDVDCDCDINNKNNNSDAPTPYKETSFNNIVYSDDAVETVWYIMRSEKPFNDKTLNAVKSCVVLLSYAVNFILQECTCTMMRGGCLDDGNDGEGDSNNTTMSPPVNVTYKADRDLLNENPESDNTLHESDCDCDFDNVDDNSNDNNNNDVEITGVNNSNENKPEWNSYKTKAIDVSTSYNKETIDNNNDCDDTNITRLDACGNYDNYDDNVLVYASDNMHPDDVWLCIYNNNGTPVNDDVFIEKKSGATGTGACGAVGADQYFVGGEIVSTFEESIAAEDDDDGLLMNDKEFYEESDSHREKKKRIQVTDIVAGKNDYSMHVDTVAVTAVVDDDYTVGIDSNEHSNENEYEYEYENENENENGNNNIVYKHRRNVVNDCDRVHNNDYDRAYDIACYDEFNVDRVHNNDYDRAYDIACYDEYNIDLYLNGRHDSDVVCASDNECDNNIHIENNNTVWMDGDKCKEQLQYNNKRKRNKKTEIESIVQQMHEVGMETSVMNTMNTSMHTSTYKDMNNDDDNKLSNSGSHRSNKESLFCNCSNNSSWGNNIYNNDNSRDNGNENLISLRYSSGIVSEIGIESSGIVRDIGIERLSEIEIGCKIFPEEENKEGHRHNNNNIEGIKIIDFGIKISNKSLDDIDPYDYDDISIDTNDEWNINEVIENVTKDFDNNNIVIENVTKEFDNNNIRHGDFAVQQQNLLYNMKALQQHDFVCDNNDYVNDPYDLKIDDEPAIDAKPTEGANIDEIEEYKTKQEDDDNTMGMIENGGDAASTGVIPENNDNEIEQSNSNDYSSDSNTNEETGVTTRSGPEIYVDTNASIVTSKDTRCLRVYYQDKYMNSHITSGIRVTELEIPLFEDQITSVKGIGQYVLCVKHPNDDDNEKLKLLMGMFTIMNRSTLLNIAKKLGLVRNISSEPEIVSTGEQILKYPWFRSFHSTQDALFYVFRTKIMDAGTEEFEKYRDNYVIILKQYEFYFDEDDLQGIRLIAHRSVLGNVDNGQALCVTLYGSTTSLKYGLKYLCDHMCFMNTKYLIHHMFSLS